MIYLIGVNPWNRNGMVLVIAFDFNPFWPAGDIDRYWFTCAGIHGMKLEGDIVIIFVEEYHAVTDDAICLGHHGQLVSKAVVVVA